MYCSDSSRLDARVDLNSIVWQRLFSQIQSRAYRIACLDLGQTDLAWDLVQESAIALMQSYGDRPSEEFVPLFYRILQNRIRDQHRRQKLERILGLWSDRKEGDPDPMDLLADPAPSPEGVLTNQELSKAIHAAIQKLPSRQRQAFLLREWEGLSIEETAIAMGCSTGSVKVHHFRALRHLREYLADWTPEGYFHEP